MWKLYDELIEAIPRELTAQKIVRGATWTAVLSSAGTVGLAMSTPVETLPPDPDIREGMKLRDLAEKVKSWNFTEAAIGMAAINAFYNSPERLRELDCAQRDSRFCSFDISHEGKNVTMVGALRYPEDMFSTAARLIILERNIVPGTYPDSACEYFIPDSQLVIITGSAFINKTMPRLLSLAKNADVVITGPSGPMTKKLLSHGVRRVAGLVITDVEGCLSFVASGAFSAPYKYGERYIVE